VPTPQSRGLLARSWWTLERFGLTPAKLIRRVANGDEPMVLCVSIPKAGTNLLERAVCLHPHLYRKLRRTVRGAEVRSAGVERALGRLRPGQVVLAHLPFDGSLPGALDALSVSTLFLIRNPKDVVVSEAHYLRSNARHRLHRRFMQQGGIRDMILLAIRGDRQSGVISIGEKLERYQGWLDSGALVVRFEDLIGSAGGGTRETQLSTIKSIYHHLGLGEDEGFLSTVAERLFFTGSPTFRRGAIGGWRKHFDGEIEEAFAESVGDRVVSYGYAAQA
jgi:sulfotransferase family protein